MKRKLFTLLFALVALAAFQAKAQVNYYWIDADTTTNPGATGVAASPGATTQYFVDQNWTPNTSQLKSETTAFNVTGDLNHKFGVYSRYFKINYSAAGTQQFDIFNYGGTKLNLSSVAGSSDKWNVVRFDVTGKATAQSLDKQTGFQTIGSGTGQTLTAGTYVEGYLVYPTTGSELASDANFKLVLVNRTTGEVALQTYSWWKTADNQKVWNPVWVRFMPIGGRWATPKDFAEMEFIQFRDKSGNLLNVNDNVKTSAAFNTFRVTYLPTYSPKAGTTATDAVDTIATHNQGRRESGMYFNTTTSKWEVPVFQLTSPEDSCKLVSVAKNNVKVVIGGASNGAYADKLEMRRTTTSVGFPDEEAGAQQFAIWIDMDGNMSIYPRVAYVADYSKVATDAARWLPTTNESGTVVTASAMTANKLLTGNLNYGYYQYNASIYRNNWNMPTYDLFANQAIKIGTYTQGQITPVLTPVSGFGAQTEYTERIFTPRDASNYQIKTGRFFFLETRAVNAPAFTGGPSTVNNTKTYVLSVFGAKNIPTTPTSLYTNIHSKYNDWTNANVHTQIALTPKEQIRGNGTEKNYFENPFDSTRMASHWQVIEVRGANGELAGYKFQNELGYDLQFNASMIDLSKTPVFPPITTDQAYTSAVWQAIRMDGDSEYFYLRNNFAKGLNGTDYTNANWPLISSPAQSLYLDTAAVTGGNYGWTQYYSEKPASVSGNIIKTAYWQKPVQMTYGSGCGGGIEFKLTSDEDNWPPSKGTAQEHGQTGVIDHTNDALYPKQDSLCTYMHREGVYNITEALGLKLSVTMDANGVVLVDSTKSFGDVSVEPVGDERKPMWVQVNATQGYWSTKGYLGTDAMWEANWLKSLNTGAEFGALAGSVRTYASDNNPASDATGNILIGSPTNLQPNSLKDINVPDNYKWHYVKLNGLYLVYDTINYTTSNPTGMYGFKFKAVSKQNATPIRMYQPLVGDKKYENYIIEFRVPDFYYETDNSGNIIAPNAPMGSAVGQSKYPMGDSRRTHQLRWYSSSRPAPAVYSQTEFYTSANSQFVAGVSRYARIGQQSNIVTTLPTPLDATRWRFTGEELVGCKQQFVSSNYLLQTGMYTMPTIAEAYNLHIAQNYFISKDANEKQTLANATNLTYTLADTLFADATMAYGGQGWIGQHTYNNNIGRYYGFNQNYNNKINVELFYVTNSEGLYLTVTDSTDMNQTAGITVPDVSGAKLQFRPKITYTAAQMAAGEYDRRPLQMFAIHGCLNYDGDQLVNGKAKGYGEFIYLPATSYIMDYTTGITNGDKANNVNLGLVNASGYTNVTSAFRIGLYGRDNHLVVMPASGTTSTSIVAAEYKFTRDGYYKGPFCHHSFVKRVSTNLYFTGKGTTNCADLTKPEMHWEIDYVKDALGNIIDSTLFNMRPELKIQSGQAYVPTQLKDQYYFIKQAQANRFLAIPKSAPKDTMYVDITCIDEVNTNPLVCTDNYYKFNQEQLVSSDWGIIEGYYTDRCVWTDDASISKYPNPSTIWRADAIGKQLPTGTQANFLVIEPSYTRIISEHHNVPYYNIVRVKDGVRYYLQMRGDSTVFRTVTASELDTLSNYNQYPTALASMKFCFPYRTVAGTCPAQIEMAHYKAPNQTTTKDFPKVFVQSLDTVGVPAYLLKIQSTSGKLAAKQIDVTTINYSTPLGNLNGELDATTWFFGDNYGSDYEWVELVGARTKQDTKGALTNATNSNPGSMYVVPSAADPNYGILDVYKTTVNPNMTFEFEGDTVIGNYSAKPIWYYKIKTDKGLYLTNAAAKTDAKYFGSEGKPYAYFDATALPNAPINGNKIKHDAKYDQTFGLRHVPVDKQPGKKENMYFWVVSRVDYQTPGNTQYYYLSQINSRMVFSKADLNNKEAVLDAAMMFQLGTANDSGYTDIAPVEAGVAKIYGIEGAVKVVNAAGLVEVYTIDGRLVKSVNVNSAEETIAAPRGVVIVKNGANVAKVVVK